MLKSEAEGLVGNKLSTFPTIVWFFEPTSIEKAERLPRFHCWVFGYPHPSLHKMLLYGNVLVTGPNVNPAYADETGVCLGMYCINAFDKKFNQENFAVVSKNVLRLPTTINDSLTAAFFSNLLSLEQRAGLYINEFKALERYPLPFAFYHEYITFADDLLKKGVLQCRTI